MGLWRSFVDFFRNLMDPDSGAVRGELKKVHAEIARLKPPYYRFKGNMVLPGFAQDLYLFCQALKPLMDLADRTIGHPDLRISRRYFDYIVECELPPGETVKKEHFSYEGMKLRIQDAVKGDEEYEAIGRDFQRYLRFMDGMSAGPLNVELAELERFMELCRHDWERTLGFFDPSASLDDPRYVPDFQPCDGETALPELVDMFYLTEGFEFSDGLFGKVMKALEKHSPSSAASQKPKMARIFGTLNKVLRLRLSPANLLAMVRLAKGDPSYRPDTTRDRVDYVEQYRRRLMTQFERDRERLQRERHESAVAADIRELFEGTDAIPVEEYDEENDQYLRRESPNGFTHIKALGILKTFVHGIFDARIKDPLKKILVEGYFDSKTFQNNLANILFQCDRTAGRIMAFEESLKGGGRVSLAAVKRYVEEMRHGKDIMPFLTKIVDEINYKAQEICEDETGLFQMLGENLGDLLGDYKKAAPDLVTNIRSLGGGRNKEIMAGVADARRKLQLFVRVMRNFAVVKNLPPERVPVAIDLAARDGAGAAESAAATPGPAMPALGSFPPPEGGDPVELAAIEDDPAS